MPHPAAASSQIVDKEMNDPMMRGGCDSGLLPDHIVCHCGVCLSNNVAMCDECNNSGRQYFHQPQRVKLVGRQT